MCGYVNMNPFQAVTLDAYYGTAQVFLVRGFIH